MKKLIGAAIVGMAIGACGFVALLGRAAGPVVPGIAPGAGAGANAVVFAKPERIRYDEKSLIIDGKPVFIYSGAFHYFRCPRELWKDRFSRMKEAGLNCVETYLAWNYHEMAEPSGPGDFSKLQHMDELNDFIQMARDMGFYVIIRPGPYICAEWDRGGFPEWLLKYAPADFKVSRDGGGFLRSANPVMLQWDKHWFEAAAKVVKPHLVTNLPAGKPGVVLWQVENEYNLCEIPPAEQAVVLRALVEDSIAAGIDVPLFACRTKSANADAYLQAHLFDSVTCYPKYDMSILVSRIGNIAEPQPGKFRAAMELQAGWFSEVNGKRSEEMGFSAAQLNQLGVVALEQGCSLINWYMFYGGTQLGYGAAQNMTQSYDYDAPIRESGGVGPRYLAAKALGLMLQEHGTRLARSTAVQLNSGDLLKELNLPNPQPPNMNARPDDVHVAVRKTEDGSHYYFVRTDSRDDGRRATILMMVEGKKVTLNYDLPPFGAKILYVPPGASVEQGEWLPKAVNGPARPQNVPEVKIKAMPVAAATEEFVNWRPVKTGQTFASMGIPDSRYVAFRSSFQLTDEQVKNPPTLFGHTAGAMLLFAINGKLVPPEEAARAGLVALAGRVKAGENRVEVLLENIGNANHDGLDVDRVAPELVLLPGGAGASMELKEWRMKSIGAVVSLAGVQLDVAGDLNVLDWPRVSVNDGPNLPAEGTTGVFHTSLDVTAEQLKGGMTLALGMMDETGDVFVNGVRVGGNVTEHCVPFSADITKFLKVGRNGIAVVVANRDHAGGLYGGAFLVGAGQKLEKLEMSMETQPAAEAASTPLLQKCAMEFKMPAKPVGMWVPYYLHLEAHMNGQVYLNGHHLGTYWGTGPQQDIWLPECWLNMEGQNLLVVQARPTAGVMPQFEVAEIRAYTEFAESR